ncbi:MAG: alcohol dehydrogenase catalytic domain-containing protein [Verrucomicrobia bacterium]|nr:alcohol dehydrogenase catalytic domain-containing protein [Verrucomicrobiota bacterium]
MKALFFDGKPTYREDYSEPHFKPGCAIIAVKLAGICNTDLEITRGYMGFKGVLGHEFAGIVVDCEDHYWHGKRVVGEINAGCGQCEWCRKGLGRHCPYRTVLGIAHHDGCMAEYCMLPVENLHEIPKAMPNEVAVFTEPVSAACEIIEQIEFKGDERVIVLGDGKLGILCAWVLSTVASSVTLVGHHPEKLGAAEWNGIETTSNLKSLSKGADIVVDATGSSSGLSVAISLCRPRGTLVLKSTVSEAYAVDLAPVVINELNVVGSRCGCFKDGLAFMQGNDIPLDRLITAKYALEEAEEAFARARQSDALKILLEIEQTPV